jgi:hypothetical protein
LIPSPLGQACSDARVGVRGDIDHPHPCPLPGREGEFTRSTGVGALIPSPLGQACSDARVGVRGDIDHPHPCPLPGREGEFTRSTGVGALIPSPLGGEGQGEGNQSGGRVE